MTSFKKYVWAMARQCNLIAAAAVFAMMALTCADVFLRLFRRPIVGTYELVSFLGAIAIAFAMANTSVEKGHVAVSLIVQLFPKRMQALFECLIAMLSMLLFGLIAWQSLLYGIDCQRVGEVSLTLHIPKYPLIYGIACGAAMVCVVLVVDVIDALARVKHA